MQRHNCTLVDTNAARIAGERMSQRLVTAFVLSGIFFMLLPGTFLGVWNLLSISQAHDVGMLPQAWLQAHGQAQLFGWIGSFILGIGFYSLTKMQSGRGFPARTGWTVWFLWTLGVTLRWLAGVTALELEGRVAIVRGPAACGLCSFLYLRPPPSSTCLGKAGGLDANRWRVHAGFLDYAGSKLRNPVLAGVDWQHPRRCRMSSISSSWFWQSGGFSFQRSGDSMRAGCPSSQG